MDKGRCRGLIYGDQLGESSCSQSLGEEWYRSPRYWYTWKRAVKYVLLCCCCCYWHQQITFQLWKCFRKYDQQQDLAEGLLKLRGNQAHTESSHDHAAVDHEPPAGIWRSYSDRATWNVKVTIDHCSGHDWSTGEAQRCRHKEAFGEKFNNNNNTINYTIQLTTQVIIHALTMLVQWRVI